MAHGHGHRPQIIGRTYQVRGKKFTVTCIDLEREREREREREANKEMSFGTQLKVSIYMAVLLLFVVGSLSILRH